MLFFLKQKTAYEMRISDWSSDGGSSDLGRHAADEEGHGRRRPRPGAGPHGHGREAAGAAGGAGPGGGERHLRRRHSAGRRAGLAPGAVTRGRPHRQIGRASWRERVWQNVYIKVVSVSFKKTTESA